MYIPHLCKFSRDIYFADVTNSAFLQFYFQGSQDFGIVYTVSMLLLIVNFRGLNFCGPQVICENSKIYVPRKFVRVQYMCMYVYVCLYIIESFPKMCRVCNRLEILGAIDEISIEISLNLKSFTTFHWFLM